MDSSHRPFSPEKECWASRRQQKKPSAGFGLQIPRDITMVHSTGFPLVEEIYYEASCRHESIPRASGGRPSLCRDGYWPTYFRDRELIDVTEFEKLKT